MQYRPLAHGTTLIANIGSQTMKRAVRTHERSRLVAPMRCLRKTPNMTLFARLRSCAMVYTARPTNLSFLQKVRYFVRREPQMRYLWEKKREYQKEKDKSVEFDYRICQNRIGAFERTLGFTSSLPWIINSQTHYSARMPTCAQARM